MKQIKVVAGIIKFDNKILCMQRDKSKYDYISYKWEFPGGKIEDGETYENALIRELQEEMELEVEIKNHYCDVTHQYPDFEITMHVFMCESKSSDFKLNVHKDFRWLWKEDLNMLNWAAADWPIVNKLQNKKEQ